MTIGKDFELTWLGHAAFHLVTPGGKHLLFDPWLANPRAPAGRPRPSQVHAILLTHGHSDHVGDAVALAHEHPAAECVGSFEMCLWLKGKGAAQIRPMNKGGTQKIAGLDVTMVGADHSSGIDDGGVTAYGGEPCGYVVTLENGFKVYHAGDTNVFLDMQLIRELYAPDLACLPIGGHFTMGPREAARAVELLGARWIVPMHYGTFPLLAGTPAELRKLLAGRAGAEVLAVEPGETVR